MNCKLEPEGNMCPMRMMNVYGTIVIKIHPNSKKINLLIN